MKTRGIVQISFSVLLIFLCGFSIENKNIIFYKQLISTNCDNTNSNTNPDYVNRYKRIETYIPDENTAIKHIKIAVNIFTGPGTIQKTTATIDAVNQMIIWLNGFYTNVDSATYPIAGVPRLTDTKIRFDLDGRIFFYEGTKLYNSTSIPTMENYIAKLDSTHLDYLNIYMTAGSTSLPYSIPPYPGFILKDGSDLTATSLYSNQGVYISSINPSYINSQTLAHEIGHSLDLFHTYNPSCCHETCDASDPEYLYDLFGPNPPAYCWERGGFGCKITPGKNTCTNNIMGGDNLTGYYFSPMQIGKIHRALSIKSVRKYVKDSPYNTERHTIKSNETWNFDIRWYSDIVIEPGIVLTVTGKILMADQAKIIVKKGAKLIVDGGIITGSNTTWQGVKVREGGSIFHHSTEDSGEVILKNNGKIENTLK